MTFLCGSRIFLCELAVDSLFHYLAVLTLDSDEHDKKLHLSIRGIRVNYLAVTEPAKSHLQGQRRHNHGELRHDPFLGRQRKNNP